MRRIAESLRGNLDVIKLDHTFSHLGASFIGLGEAAKVFVSAGFHAKVTRRPHIPHPADKGGGAASGI
ncbi:hypothetical protein [Rhizobium leguminosarum]|uniref:hypothetical protein n=1 Tax=Rhizobium leguminosarum TaxID=384 RepID=UPI003D0041AF